MTHAEAMRWAEYRNGRGTLNVSTRIEHGIAQLLSMMVNRTGGDKGRPVQPSEFLANREPERPMTLEEAMQVLK